MITFKNNAEAADLYIYGEITPYPMFSSDVSAEDLKEMLDEANGRPLNIYVNSGGGSVFEGQAIASMIERYKGHKTCHIDGICASIATKIPFACDEVNFAKGAYFMIHRASGVSFGTADDMLKMADTLEQIDNGLVQTYKSNSKMTEEDIRAKMKSETWYNSETINDDFSFNIIEGKQMAACVSEDTLSKFTNKPDDIEVTNELQLVEDGENIKVKLEFALL